MIIDFKTERLEHLQYMSYYNHNYYRLPYSISSNDVLYNEFDEDCNSNEWHLGVIENGKFISKMSFSGYPDDDVVDLMVDRLES